nr:hypothetical protein [Tanacetum cinerariifolium]
MVPIVPVDPLVELEVGEVSVTSPAGVSDLADSESEPAEQRPERHESLTVHDAMVSRWRDRVTSRPSLPSGSSSHDTLAPPSKCVSHRSLDRHSSPDFTLDLSCSGLSSGSSSDTLLGPPLNSLSDTSLVHSLGFDALGQSHSGTSTRVASSRLVYPPVMTPRYSEAFRRRRSVASATPYPPTTSKSSLDPYFENSLDSSSLSVGPSRKRCRSPTTLVPEEHVEIDNSDAEADADLGISDVVGAQTEDGIELIAQRVANALANYEATHAANALEAESQSQNSNDGDNGNGRNGNGRDENGNHGDRGNNENGNLNENGIGAMPVAHGCTYQDFVKCQPLNFKGTKIVVGLTRWLRRWKQCSTLEILHRIIGVDVAFSMTWRDLMKLMTKVYCSRNEIQKMETKSWNLTMKNNDLATYTQRFQESTLLCTRMVPREEDRIERYVGGWAYAFHQDGASSVRVPVANVTLFSLAYLLRENTDSIHSNQRMRLTAPSIPLK